MSDRDLDNIRKKKMQEMLHQQQNQTQEQQIKEQQEAQVNALIKKVLTQILTPDARERLANIRLARPQQAREIELVLIQLHQQGRMQKQLSDEEFKDLLSNLSKRKKDIKIKKR